MRLNKFFLSSLFEHDLREELVEGRKRKRKEKRKKIEDKRKKKKRL